MRDSPAAARRVILISEETFLRLKSQADNKDDDKGKEQAIIEPKPEQINDVIETHNSDAGIAGVSEDGDRETDPIEGIADEETTIDDEDTKAASTIVNAQSPAEEIPQRWRQIAKNYLAQLESIPAIDWLGEQGAISIEGTPLDPPFTIHQLLRSLSVPFTKSPALPSSLREFLRNNQLKPRNHLLPLADLPKWHQFFTL